MLLEDRNKGAISFDLLASYIKLTGGIPFAIFLLFMMILWDGSYIGSSLWMAHWT
jgi:hypothetical protein